MSKTQPDRIVWVDGSPQVSGTVTGISPTDIVVETDGNRRTIAAADVRRIEFKIKGSEGGQTSPPNARVQFSNGDQVTLRLDSVSETQAEVEAFGLTGLTVPRERMEGIDFEIASSAKAEEEDDSVFVSPFIFSDP